MRQYSDIPLDETRSAANPKSPLSPDGKASDEESIPCATCDGARFVGAGVPLGHKLFGRALPCPECNPSPPTYGVPWRLKDATLANFTLFNEDLRKAAKQCHNVASGESWCAMLIGDPGRGKSHLAVGALKLSAHPKPGLFWNWGGLLKLIRRQCFDENGPQLSEDIVVGRYQETPALVVLDDVGAEKQTEWAVQTLYAILNARYEKQLPTVVTTNNPDAIDQRVLSRYYSGTVTITAGNDMRREA